MKRTAGIIRRHRNFLLFVRDRRSLETAQACLDCPVYLVPDMAFCLGAIPRPVTATRKLLLLLRTDKESARPALPRNLPAGAMIADWIEEDPNLYGKRNAGRRSQARSSSGSTLFPNRDAGSCCFKTSRGIASGAASDFYPRRSTSSPTVCTATSFARCSASPTPCSIIPTAS